jgi:hypothetical protein
VVPIQRELPARPPVFLIHNKKTGKSGSFALRAVFHPLQLLKCTCPLQNIFLERVNLQLFHERVNLLITISTMPSFEPPIADGDDAPPIAADACC